jgi:hypothetical protein
MAYESLVAAVIGFAPPIALILWTLQAYTYPTVKMPYFSDPKLFNLPRVQRKVDTPFYGFGLGAGIASSLSFGAVNLALLGVGYDPAALVLMVLTSIQFALLQTATGTTIGIGVGRGTPWPFFGQAVVVHLAFVLLLAPYTSIANGGGIIFGYVCFAAATLFIASYYWYIHRKLLPAFIKDALARAGMSKARKERRTKV